MNLINNIPTVYIIAGKARHGKNTVAEEIKKIYEEHGGKTCILSFAQTIKQYAKDYFGWDGSEKTKPRELLQKLGTDIIRKKLNMPYFHVRRICEDISVLGNFFESFVIPDTRFPNEIEYTQEQDFYVKTIHVIRTNFTSPLTKEQQNHLSETALDDYINYDYEISASDISELRKKTREIINEIIL